jgi:hypothetical protein
MIGGNEAFIFILGPVLAIAAIIGVTLIIARRNAR